MRQQRRRRVLATRSGRQPPPHRIARPHATCSKPRAACAAAQLLLATQWTSWVLAGLAAAVCCALRAEGGRSADRGGDRAGARRLREADEEGEEGQGARSVRRTACRRPSGSQHSAKRGACLSGSLRRRMRSIANDRSACDGDGDGDGGYSGFSACHGATTRVLCKQQRTRLQPRQQPRRHTAACTALWIGHATSTIHRDAYQRIEQRTCAAARRRRCSAALRWHLQCGAVAVRRHSFLPCSGAQRHWAAGRTSRPSRPSCGRSRRGSIGLPDTNAEQPRAPLRSGRQAPHRTAGPVRACVSSSRFRMARQAPLPRTVARKLQWWAVTPSALPCLRASSVISSRSFKTRGRCRCTFRPLSCHRISRRAVPCRAVPPMCTHAFGAAD